MAWAGPPRHHKGFAEKLEGTDHLDHQEEKGGGADHRKGHIEKLLQRAGSVHLGGIVKLRRDGLKSGQIDHHGEAGVLPQGQDDHGGFGPKAAVEPIGRLNGQPGQVGQAPDPRRQNAKITVKKPLKDQCRRHNCGYHGHKVDEPIDLYTADRLIEGHGQNQPQRQLQRHNYHREIKGVRQHCAKDPVLHDQLAIIADAHKLGLRKQIPLKKA